MVYLGCVSSDVNVPWAKKILGLKKKIQSFEETTTDCSLHISVHVDCLFHLWSYSLRDNYFKTFLQCYEKITVMSVGEG